MKKFAALLTLILLSIALHAQDATLPPGKPFSFSDNLFNTIDKKSTAFQQKLEQQTTKYLQRLRRKEKKLQRKLFKKDSTAAASTFGNIDSTYNSLLSKFQNPNVDKARTAYSGYLDSMQTVLRFIQQNNLFDKTTDQQSKLRSALANYDGLQNKLNGTDAVKKFLQQRQQDLQQHLQSYGFTKQLNGFKEQVYYYRLQVNEYKKAFENCGEWESMLLRTLNKLPAFKNFFNSNSQLAAFFRLQGTGNDLTAENVAGLQTRSQLQQDLQQRLGSGANQQINQQVNAAQGQLDQLKSKISLPDGSNDTDMPGFKPNGQKVKSFLQRFELGTNLQSTKANNYFPTTTDLGLSIGYKLNDKSIIGLGGSYKMGWGNDIRHIRLTPEGIGLRSFLDVKVKGSFWLSGGGELNYKSQFSDFEILKNYSSWQRSALLGVTKKYKIGKKFKGNAQLLYDFLWNQQVPRTQAVLFRLGYTL